MKFCCFDTEDNSPELEERGRPGYEKKVTLVCGIGVNGDPFWFRPKVKRTIKEGSFKRYEMDMAPFYSWLTAQGDGVYCYAHNLQYDLGNVFWRPDDYDVTMVGNRIVNARWGSTVFRDTYNLWPMKLEKIGKAVGLEKGRLDVHSIDYVLRDVEITREAVRVAAKLAAEHDVELPGTLGSFAVKIWHALGGDNWHCSALNCREAYYGGRVELFREEMAGNIIYVDINSLYPFVMTRAYPTEDALWCGYGDLHRFTKALTNLKRPLFGIVRLRLDVPKCFIAPLPVETPQGISYPYGEIEGSYTIAEVRNALLHGAKIVQVFEAYGSTEAADYYGDFVRHFYELRKVEKDEGRKLFYKLLMNNLYGQLGMTGLVGRSLLLENQIETDAEGEPRLLREGIPYGSRLLAEIQMPLPDHCNYMHAAHVTSYARLEIQKYARKVPQKNLGYMDTDSLMFLHDAGKPLPFGVGNELGQMKLEAECVYAQLRGPKFYHLKDRKGRETWKAKGVSGRKSSQMQKMADAGLINDHDVMTYAQLFHRDGTVSYLQPFRLREHIHYFDKQETEGYNLESRINSVWHPVTKAHRTQYAKKVLRAGRYYPKVNEQAETDEWDWM